MGRARWIRVQGEWINTYGHTNISLGCPFVKKTKSGCWIHGATDHGRWGDLVVATNSFMWYKSAESVGGPPEHTCGTVCTRSEHMV